MVNQMQSQLSNGALISPEYLLLNQELRARNENYGTRDNPHAEEIEGFAHGVGARTILDYGCGTATLARMVKSKLVMNYDPTIPEYADPPEPADLVSSTDVLEHIEPALIDNVLDHMASLSKKAVYLVVTTRPAHKTLADGRNAHLIQEPLEWWLPKLMERWYLTALSRHPSSFCFAGIAKGTMGTPK